MIGFSSYTGLDFLLFYSALLAATIFAGFWIPANLRPEGREGSVENATELAVLAGGPVRLADSVLAGLYARGLLRIETKRLVSAGGVPESMQPGPEYALLRDLTPMKWGEARERVDLHAEPIDECLVIAGLLMGRRERMKFRLLPLAPYATLLLIGAYRWMMGNHLGEPVGFLSMLMVLALVGAIIRFAKFNPRTEAGDDALARAQERHARLKSAPKQSEVGLGVGLFGMGVLAGTPYAPLHDLRQQSVDAGSGAGDGGCGGGGCGGGGCGGCGG